MGALGDNRGDNRRRFIRLTRTGGGRDATGNRRRGSRESCFRRPSRYLVRNSREVFAVLEQTIPVVNLHAFRDESEREAFVQQLGDALRNFGFAAVEGHGIDSALIHKNYELFEQLFSLEDERKRGYEFPERGRERGYTSFGVEHAKDSEKPDLKEFWHFGRGGEEGRRENVWPAEVPGLKQNALELFDSMESVALELLSAISLYLGADADRIPAMARGGNSIVRVIHYPVCDGFDEPGVMRAAQHEDINLITLLPEATQSGLELLTTDGEWLPIPSLPGQIIVDTGDMMQRLTNDFLPARTHRVVNPQGEATDRYSMPFFCHPRPSASLAVLEECAGEGAKYPPCTADEYLQERLRAIGVA